MTDLWTTCSNSPFYTLKHPDQVHGQDGSPLPPPFPPLPYLQHPGKVHGQDGGQRLGQAKPGNKGMAVEPKGVSKGWWKGSQRLGQAKPGNEVMAIKPEGSEQGVVEGGAWCS